MHIGEDTSPPPLPPLELAALPRLTHQAAQVVVPRARGRLAASPFIFFIILFCIYFLYVIFGLGTIRIGEGSSPAPLPPLMLPVFSCLTIRQPRERLHAQGEGSTPRLLFSEYYYYYIFCMYDHFRVRLHALGERLLARSPDSPGAPCVPPPDPSRSPGRGSTSSSKAPRLSLYFLYTNIIIYYFVHIILGLGNMCI